MSQPLNQTRRLHQLVCKCGGNAVRVLSKSGIPCFAWCPKCKISWYAYHCWNKLGCNKALIDGRFDPVCKHNGVSHVCSVCGKCRCQSGFKEQAGRYDSIMTEPLEEPEEDLNSLESIADIMFNGDVDAAEHWLEKDRD